MPSKTNPKNLNIQQLAIEKYGDLNSSLVIKEHRQRSLDLVEFNTTQMLEVDTNVDTNVDTSTDTDVVDTSNKASMSYLDLYSLDSEVERVRISNDDPEILSKLAVHLEALQTRHEFMKKVNAIVKRQDFSGELKCSEISKTFSISLDHAQTLLCGFTPNHVAKVLAAVKRTKGRIEDISCREGLLSSPTLETIDKYKDRYGIVGYKNFAANKLQVEFINNPKLDRHTYSVLKKYGFTRTLDKTRLVWQKSINLQDSGYYLSLLIKELYPI